MASSDAATGLEWSQASKNQFDKPWYSHSCATQQADQTRVPRSRSAGSFGTWGELRIVSSSPPTRQPKVLGCASLLGCPSGAGAGAEGAVCANLT